MNESFPEEIIAYRRSGPGPLILPSAWLEAIGRGELADSPLITSGDLVGIYKLHEVRRVHKLVDLVRPESIEA